MRRTGLIVGSLMAAALTGGGSRAQAGTPPTLGRSLSASQEGYGQVKPTTIFNGGDPTGLVTGVTWSRWGARRAIGNGTGDWVWPGESVANGSIRTPAVVVAFDLGTCAGRPAYRKITWYFPSRGESFDPGSFQNTCSGRFSTDQPAPSPCGAVTLMLPLGHATQILARGIDCEQARQTVAGSPSIRYLHGENRFRHDGLYCGTEGFVPGLSPPTLFECARARLEITFEVAT
jgi:hypothetical protein